MRRSSVITTIIFRTTIVCGAVAASGAEARLDIYVDKSTQRLQVIQNGTVVYIWPVSTGRDKFSTPSGVYAPERLERSWFSKAYYNAPMPHAIFFHNGYAIHGSYDIARLGGPASHGCVRLHPRNAALLFAMVQQEGPSNTTIFVGGNSMRPPLRYRDYDEAMRPDYRRDAPVARGPYPREPRFDSRMPPGENPDRYVDKGYIDRGYADRRGSYPPPGPERPYGPDRYYGPERSASQDGYRRGPEVPPPYEETDRYAERRRAPHGPRVPPDYGADPYIDGRGAPGSRGFSPYYPVDRGSDGRGANPHGPKAQPYDADRYADGPGRRRGDAIPLTMRGADPANRPPRLDGAAPIERVPVDRTYGPHDSLRPVAAGAKPGPNHLADEPPNRRLTAGESGKAPPPMPTPVLPTVLPPAPTPAVSLPPALPSSAPAPVARQDSPPEPQENAGYKVLPRSYWAGASWRWRMKKDDEGAPPAASQ